MTGLAGQPPAAPAMLHATVVLVGEQGVLIRGAPGAGKTTLALALIDMARQRGMFARLVGDDRVSLALAGGRLLARPHPAIAGLVEKRWEGVEMAQHEPAAVLHAAVDIVDSGQNRLARLPEDTDRRFLWGETGLPRLALPASLGAAVQAIRIFGFLAKQPCANRIKSPDLALAN